MAHSQIIIAENLMRSGKKEEAHKMLVSVLKHFDKDAKRLANMPNPLDQKIAKDVEDLNLKIENADLKNHTEFQASFSKLKEDMKMLQERLAQYSRKQA